MTTEATENPQAPPPSVMEVAEVYRVIGRLEQAQEGTKEQIAEVKELLARHEERNEQQFARLEERNEQRSARQEERSDQQFREVNRRIDRLMYTIMGISTVAIAGYVLQQVFGA